MTGIYAVGLGLGLDLSGLDYMTAFWSLSYLRCLPGYRRYRSGTSGMAVRAVFTVHSHWNMLNRSLHASLVTSSCLRRCC